jgi:DNA helicase II / ATP-dependent DNA helicase PcrA
MTIAAVTPPEPAIERLLDRLDPEQRAAAVLPDGPAQIIAPAGSGKTTTLIARLGVLLSRGVAAQRICVVTFNRDAAAELVTRIAARLTPLVPTAGEIEVRTLHALARQILVDAGDPVRLIADRGPLLRAARRRVATADQTPEPSELDTLLSAWKVEGRAPPPEARDALLAYEALLAMRGSLDFDDLVVRAGRLIDDDPEIGERWRRRFTHLLVDEFQDVDASQLHLVRAVAEPERNLFVVGDDDQTIYAWRLADVRRILDFATQYPDAQRVMLATNYRCPVSVVSASRALIGTNAERFVKRIDPAPGGTNGDGISWVSTASPDWPDRLVTLARDAAPEARCCFLARTRGELIPLQMAMVRAGIRHATSLRTPLDAEPAGALVDGLRSVAANVAPFPALLGSRHGRGWERGGPGDSLSDDDHAALDALLGWAAGFRRTDAFLAALDEARARLLVLRDPDAPVELVTVHGAKGREWPTVVIVGFEAERMPNRRALAQAADADRALEEERRLAYVAVTRATRRLVLAFDPARPSPFLAEMALAAPRAQSPTAGATGVR